VPRRKAATPALVLVEAGLALLPFTAGIIVGAGLSQGLAPKLGAREVPLIGMSMAVVGLLLFMRLQPDGTYLTDLLAGIVLMSIGMGLNLRARHAHCDERRALPTTRASRPGSTTRLSRSAVQRRRSSTASTSHTSVVRCS
jgi:hypothetical protein